jgi:hypothetical protein
MITNRQRIEYILDTLAEPFSDESKEIKCDCAGGDPGGNQTPTNATPNGITNTGVPEPIVKSKRELIEEAIIDALPEAKQVSTSMDEVLDNMTEEEIGGLLTHLDVPTIDQELRDLAIFMTPGRLTTLRELRRKGRGPPL